MSYGISMSADECGDCKKDHCCSCCEHYGLPSFTVTYNYADHFYRVFGENGIRTIYGKTGEQAIQILKAAMAQLGTDVTENHWDATEGNARRALSCILAECEKFPKAKINGD